MVVNVWELPLRLSACRSDLLMAMKYLYCRRRCCDLSAVKVEFPDCGLIIIAEVIVLLNLVCLWRMFVKGCKIYQFFYGEGFLFFVYWVR